MATAIPPGGYKVGDQVFYSRADANGKREVLKRGLKDLDENGNRVQVDVVWAQGVRYYKISYKPNNSPATGVLGSIKNAVFGDGEDFIAAEVTKVDAEGRILKYNPIQEVYIENGEEHGLKKLDQPDYSAYSRHTSLGQKSAATNYMEQAKRDGRLQEVPGKGAYVLDEQNSVFVFAPMNDQGVIEFDKAEARIVYYDDDNRKAEPHVLAAYAHAYATGNKEYMKQAAKEGIKNTVVRLKWNQGEPVLEFGAHKHLSSNTQMYKVTLDNQALKDIKNRFENSNDIKKKNDKKAQKKSASSHHNAPDSNTDTDLALPPLPPSPRTPPRDPSADVKDTPPPRARSPEAPTPRVAQEEKGDGGANGYRQDGAGLGLPTPPTVPQD